MDHLEVEQPVRYGRRRGLSINSVTDAQKDAMNSSLDNLQNDLNHVESQWNRILSDDSNPLELALAFLDDTSVGLGHKYKHFKQLKTKIGYDLQEAVNEHFQALNSNVASYGVAVDSITEAQDSILQVKSQVNESGQKITMKKDSLRDFNDNAMKRNQVIEVLSSLENLTQIPDKIEEHIRRGEYREAQKMLARGFVAGNTHDLWSMSSLAFVRQQLESQEHALFTTILEELHNIIYSRNGLVLSDRNILENIGISQDGFTNLENYLYTVVNVDVMNASKTVNDRLQRFLAAINNLDGFQEDVPSGSGTEKEFGRIYSLLSILNDINKLPSALNILVSRSKEEFHSIILRSTEEVRANHPSLLKIAENVTTNNEFGISVNDALSIIIRKCFWKIFIKLLLAAQGHRVVFETVKSFQFSAAAASLCKFDEVWAKLLDEIQVLLSRYLNNPEVLSSQNSRVGDSTVSTLPQRKDEQLFSLQKNIEDSSAAKEHASELKGLLQAIFPGINLLSNAELESVYVEEESYEQEEALVPASVFNIKIILEPLLVFCQASSDLIPEEQKKQTTPSLDFFVKYMNTSFFPRLQMTMLHLFVSKVESNNPFALENLEENRCIFKAASDFKNLYYKLLYVMNTTYTFRNNVTKVMLDCLERFFSYYYKLFTSLFGTGENNLAKRIITAWLMDRNLMGIESKILAGEEGLKQDESTALFKLCPQFFRRGKGLNKADVLNSVTFDAVTHFLSTVSWILSWLPNLRKPVDSNEKNSKTMSAEELRAHWSFFESSDLSNIERLSTLKLSLDVESQKRFDALVGGFQILRTNLLSAVRFDLRARCIFHIGTLFQETTDWNFDVVSIELDEHIASLISELKMTENKVKQQVGEREKDRIFMGIDEVNNHAFIAAAQSITVLNENGIKKLSRNMSVLQHTCRNLLSDPSKVDMSRGLNFYSLCGSSDSTLFRLLEKKELFYPLENLKTILRLQFSEDLNRQMKMNSSGSKSVNTMPVTKRYNEAVRKLDEMQAAS
ncbi:hypothetical protein ZYGR_0AI06730 [Zygosaccharomyces rouxii]|uniref:Exocyst complex component Sec8 n=1 Tax=Zygosaccharomyces rouxii TaxID=4956 RepID=A0A1Q3AC95_ZYGRO|nr:hypothetical protein ZYGR_0AI06730 [Zygosaccharomyces rouxii]